jgi:hypothetical protein
MQSNIANIKALDDVWGRYPNTIDKDEFHPEPSNKDEFYEEFGPRKIITDDLSDLWEAVLGQALWDYKDHIRFKRYEHIEFKEVFDWFFNENCDELGAFRYICDTLDINNIKIIHSLVRWTKENAL